MINALLASMRPEPDGWVLVMLQIGMMIFIAVFVAVVVRLVLIKDKGTTHRYSSMPLEDDDPVRLDDAGTHGSVSHG